MLNTKNEKGFTLIELLIVIVIIGILAGVLIAIINPAAQQNRARDANVKATMNKVALATQGFIAAYGRAPNGSEMLASLDNAFDQAATCDTNAVDAASVCNFRVTGNALPFNATATAGCVVGTGWNGNSNTQCYYHYYRGASTTTFNLFAKSFGINNTVFGYSNATSEIRNCAADTIAEDDVLSTECSL